MKFEDPSQAASFKGVNYEDLPYESQPCAFSHPDHLASIATLLHLEPKRPGESRVLELGCASGNNIIPAAWQYPASSFIGIDQAARHIEAGRDFIARLGLRNIELRQSDLTALPEDLGLFDYIICHGVFSWVAKELQTKLLQACEKHLALNGIAYISYNTYPGWHIRRTVRDMLLFHAEQGADVRKGIELARTAAKFYAREIRSHDPSETAFLRSAMAAVDKLPDWYLFHDLLERDNHPVYFMDFLGRAEAAGLRVIADADVTSIAPQELPAAVQKELRQLSPNPVLFEQTMDFLRVRLFRQSLLCRRDVPIKSIFDLGQLELLSAACGLRPGEGGAAGGVQKFVSADGTGLETRDVLVQQVLLRLAGEFPDTVAFNDVLRGLAQPPGGEEPLERQVAAVLFRCYLGGFLKLSLERPPAASAVPERPAAYGVSRAQAAAASEVTNCWHEVIALDEPSRKLLLLLDGTRGLSALEREFEEVLSEEERTALKKEGSRSIGEALPAILRNICHAGLLAA